MTTEASRTERDDLGDGYRVGQKASFTKTIVESDVATFAGITGDFNPMHIDAEFAKTTRFKGRIAHGILVSGLISAVLGTRLPGPGCLYLGQQLKFVAPVFIGDTITATVEIVQVREDKPIITLKTECHNQRGEIVVEGQAVVYAERK